jgi:hypothetical protein
MDGFVCAFIGVALVVIGWRQGSLGSVIAGGVVLALAIALWAGFVVIG